MITRLRLKAMNPNVSLAVPEGEVVSEGVQMTEKDLWTQEAGAEKAEKPSFTKSSQQIELEATLLAEKTIFGYEEDFIAMTVLCYLSVNSKKYMITSVKQSQMLNSCMLVQSVVLSMLFATLYAIKIDEQGAYTPIISHSHALWFVKFACATALHFALTPQI
jgi:hypothetical protein